MLAHLPDGSFISLIGGVTVRIIAAEVTVTCHDGTRYGGTYRLAATLLDHRTYPAQALIALYHERWEHELTYLALRHTLLHGRVLRSGDPEGLKQEMWALLSLYQALRTAITDAVQATPGTDPDRASYQIAVDTAQTLVTNAPNVLDAPCGTGSYFSMVAAAGYRVLGADQSAGMLAQARARGIAVALDQVRLQDLPYDSEFDAILTIDAMEHIPPEDWPLVLANLHHAARTGGLLYLRVEEVAGSVIDDAFATPTRRGLPVVRGEVVDGDVGGYHYYPGPDQVTAWFQAAGLHILEGFQQEDGWGYRHFLLQRATGNPG